GRLHALRPHSHTVADRDGVELHRRATRRADALFHLDRQLTQIVIARHGLNPGIRDADDGLGQVFVRESDRLEHGARWRAVAALTDRVALQFHRKFLSYRMLEAARGWRRPMGPPASGLRAEKLSLLRG